MGFSGDRAALAILVALTNISFQAFRSAMANPVNQPALGVTFRVVSLVR